MRTPEQSGKDVSVGDADKDGYHTYWHKDFPQVQIKIKFSIEDCREVLDRCLRRHDASLGMSWDIMDCHIDDLLDEKKT